MNGYSEHGSRTPAEAAQATGEAIRSWARGLIRYDAERRRVWLADQRVHHGLTGAMIAATGIAGLAAKRMKFANTIQFALLGTALMADDWHDRGVWLAREQAPR